MFFAKSIIYLLCTSIALIFVLKQKLGGMLLTLRETAFQGDLWSSALCSGNNDRPGVNVIKLTTRPNKLKYFFLKSLSILVEYLHLRLRAYPKR